VIAGMRAMHDAHSFLQNLALVLCVAAITTVVFQRLRQPVVFGYLLAGMIVGPHIPIPLVADEEMIRTLSELGVVLLLFSLGLEFSLRRLFQVGPTAGLVAVAQSGAMVWIGYLLGQLFGWTTLESVYAGAIIAISSTTIIAKAFEEQGVRGKVTDIVLGVLIIEDLIGIFLIAILTAVSAGGGVSAGSLALTGARLAIFLVGLVVVGLLAVPRTVRFVVRMGRPETTLVAAMGLCFAAALLALTFGYSVALGAFIAGSLVAESGEEKVVEHLVRPVRDVFAAIFFIAVGMLIDPALIARHWGAVLAFTIAVVLGKVTFVTLSSFLTGYSPRIAVQAGMSLAQIGEFSFIIAAVGLSTGATRDFLYPVAVAVSAITTLTTPWLIRAAVPAATYIDRKLPRRLQTFASLYGSWIERIRTSPTVGAARSRTRRHVRLLFLDTAMIAAVVIAAALETSRFSAMIMARTNIPETVARLVILVAAATVGLPLLIGLVRTARRLGLELALKALPAAETGKADFAAAPRRALVVTLQIAVITGASFLVLAVTQPFVPALRLAPFLLLLLAALAIAFWRGATDLQGHARAGAEIIAMTLSRQMAVADGEQLGHEMEQVRTALPGLGEPESVRIPPSSPAADRTLAELNLRGLTGATVLTILRDGGQRPVPSGSDVVRVGDVLAIAGSHDAIQAARELLAPKGGEQPNASDFSSDGAPPDRSSRVDLDW
jgi:monovalent cation:H+ antiporter-2, CPA2 family